MRNRGMTLLEIMFASAIFTVVMTLLFGMAIGFGDTAEVQQLKLASQDEARAALLFLVPDLRQSISSTINWAQLPGPVLTYKVATDVDGNGTAVDGSGRIEMSAQRTVGRDTADVNHDGFSTNQLVVTCNGVTRVLANNLAPDSEHPDATGAFGAAQDTNGNGQMDCGVWFERMNNNGVRITLQTVGQMRRGQLVRTTIQEIVIPRN
jgi:prepilin-type N-terminal cleavage/methylation domain-containing protein